MGWVLPRVIATQATKSGRSACATQAALRHVRVAETLRAGQRAPGIIAPKWRRRTVVTTPQEISAGKAVPMVTSMLGPSAHIGTPSLILTPSSAARGLMKATLLYANLATRTMQACATPSADPNMTGSVPCAGARVSSGIRSNKALFAAGIVPHVQQYMATLLKLAFAQLSTGFRHWLVGFRYWLVIFRHWLVGQLRPHKP